MAVKHEEQIHVQEDLESVSPKMAKVILLNDDYTSMDFVVWILVDIFYKTLQEAVTIMLNVHEQGSGVCGIYPYDIAQIKAHRVMELAHQEEFPLQCIVEEI